jgi:uncharacterized membrane protein
MRSLAYLLPLICAVAAMLHRFHMQVVLAALLLEVACTLGNWRIASGQVRPHVVYPPQVRTASLAPAPMLRLLWPGYAALMLPLVSAAAYLHFYWQQLPKFWPVHWDINGRPNRWAHRNLETVYFELFFGCVEVLFFLLMNQFLARSRTGSQRCRIAATLLIAAAGVAFLQTYIAMLPVLHFAEVHALLVVNAAVVLLALGYTLHRLPWKQESTQEVEPYDGTPDACWHWGGIFYSNPEDPSVWVPKRAGLGYTLNLARPGAWFFLLAILGVPLLLSAFLVHVHA